MNADFTPCVFVYVTVGRHWAGGRYLFQISHFAKQINYFTTKKFREPTVKLKQQTWRWRALLKINHVDLSKASRGRENGSFQL
jgi:hypothetical protein